MTFNIQYILEFGSFIAENTILYITRRKLLMLFGEMTGVIVKTGAYFKNYIKHKGGKQWQTTPKNLPRMQRTRAIPVA